MELIPDADQRESDGDGENDARPTGLLLFEKQSCGIKSTASEEVAKMGDFIEMGNIKGEFTRWVKLIPMRKKVQHNEPKEQADCPKAGRAVTVVGQKHLAYF